MLKLKHLLILFVFSFFGANSHAQTVDSLNVFPNPFSSTATIRFDLAQSDTITLRVFNMLGSKLITYFQATILPSGTYNINLIGDTLPNGVYLVRLDIGSSKSITKKVMKNNATAGIQTNHLNKNKILFPNPTKDKLSIPIEGEKMIVITDLNGRILKSMTTELEEISLLELENGSYFITVFNKKKEIVVSQKVVKVN